MQVLNGVENAEHELNRYLLVCGMLEHCDIAEPSSSGKAYIIWECDICHSHEHDVCMRRQLYKQQYRMWKAPGFCSSLRKNALRLPISECLVTPSECTMHYDLLPDLGPFFRNMLQRFYYTDASRKLMLRSIRASVGNSNGWNCSSTALPSSYSLFNIWNAMMHGVCISLLLESIPCMKRSKRNRLFSSTADSSDENDSCESSSLTEVMACINVMHGTLLKLYPLGAKTPTFNTRMNITWRMHQLTSCSSSKKDLLLFMHQHPSLMRICFMEYSVNALFSWLPAERDLLFESPAFSSHRSAMQTYSNIVAATCDLFRQDFLITGSESWDFINASAAACVDRCIRVCRFKIFRMPEPLGRNPHVQLDALPRGAFDASTKAVFCTDVAGRMFPAASSSSVEALVQLYSQVQVFALPRCAMVGQLDAVDRLHSTCSKRVGAVKNVSFCMVCAINGRPFSSTKLRMCCFTGQLSCIHCTVGGTVVTVNMAGVLLRICSTYYYMCPRCTRVRTWFADGNDMCPWLLSQGADANAGDECSCSQVNIPSHPAISRDAAVCVVCTSRNIVHRATMLIPSVKDRRMMKVHLCSRHAPPDFMLGMVTSIEEFRAIVCHHCNNSRSGSSRKGRNLKYFVPD